MDDIEESNTNEKTLEDGPDLGMDCDDGPLINENSNGLSHILTEGEFESVDAHNVEESISNPGFMHAAELSSESAADYLANNTDGFNLNSFDIGDNAISFPNEVSNLSETTNEDSRDVHKETVVLSDTSQNSYSKASDVDEVSQSNEDQKEFNLEDKHKEEVVSEQMDINNDMVVLDEVTDQDDGGTEQRKRKADNKVDEIVKIEDKVVIKSKKADSAEETEVVSEDELPTVEKPSVKDAENVSDDELPGPKAAELPADTEVVSEDELPASKKETPGTPNTNRKRKNEEHDKESSKSPVATTENTNKKQAVAKNGESKPVPSEKRPSTEEKAKKKLPELDKYWKVVNDDPTDFTGWTYLLQYVDQESDVEAAREAYDAFLSHYPYCYGYWRKYADYEKRKGSKTKCYEVLERGLKAIPLSVDLWIHYLNHVKATKPDEHSYIRQQYEKAIDACGLEFRSDRMWESYIKWETENGTPLNVTKIYDRLLATPTLGYTSHFDNFQEHVMSERVQAVIEKEELVKLRAEVRETMPAPPPADLPPGEDEPEDHISSEEEGQAIKERIIAARRKVHKTTGEQVALRWTFEEGIKRPYFHVKPLERVQLKNWKNYLEWEKQHGSFRRALVLHERCLIACALYEESWLKLVKFLEERGETDESAVALQRDVLERACTIHHLDKPALHLHWAHFEEEHGHAARAADILERIEKACPNLVQIAYRRINLERRRGDYDKCCQLYEGYIANTKNKAIATALSIKFARFLVHIKKDRAAARKVLDEALVKDPLAPKLHLQRLDLAIHTPGVTYQELAELGDSYSKQQGAEMETTVGFLWRQVELAEEFGDAASARRAADKHRALAKLLRKRNRQAKITPAATAAPPAQTETAKKKEPTTNNAAQAPVANSGPQPGGPQGQGYYGAPQQYDQGYGPPYQAPWGYQHPPPPNPYHQPWPNYPNYY